MNRKMILNNLLKKLSKIKIHPWRNVQSFSANLAMIEETWRFITIKNAPKVANPINILWLSPPIKGLQVNSFINQQFGVEPDLFF
jgi:hypothetical protein